MLWIALNCSKCAQTTEAVMAGYCVALLSRSVRASDTTSGHVAGNLSGSRPAFSNASLLYQTMQVEELNGSDISLPSA